MVQTGVAVVLGVVAPPLFIGLSSLEVYGTWIMIQTAGVFTAFLDLGLGTGLTQAVALETGRGVDRPGAQGLQAARGILVGVALSGAIAAALVAGPLLSLLLSLGAVRDLTAAQVWAGFAVFLAALLTVVPSAFLRGVGRYDLWFLTEAAGAFGTVGVTIGALWGGAALWAFPGGTAAGLLIRGVLLRYAIARIGLSPAYCRHMSLSGSAIKSSLRLGGSDQAVRAYNAILTVATRSILGRWGGAAEIAAYEVAKRAAGVISSLGPPLFSPLLAVGARMSAEGNTRAFQAVIAELLWALFRLSVAVTLFVLLFGDRLLALWLPEEAARRAQLVLPVLVAGASIEMISGPVTVGSLSHGRLRPGLMKLLVGGASYAVVMLGVAALSGNPSPQAVALADGTAQVAGTIAAGVFAWRLLALAEMRAGLREEVRAALLLVMLAAGITGLRWAAGPMRTATADLAGATVFGVAAALYLWERASGLLLDGRQRQGSGDSGPPDRAKQPRSI